MISLRMMIFAGVAGIALWGLFQLVDNLKEPGLLRSDKGVAVKGCSSIDSHKDSARLCPPFICQKTLIDRKLVPLQAKFSMTIDRTDAGQRLIGGHAAGAEQSFVCVATGFKIDDVRLLSATELTALAAASAPWTL